MITLVIVALLVLILAQLLFADRVQRRSMLERNDRLRLFLKSLQDRQEEFISLTEVLLQQATEHPVKIRRSNDILGPAETPTWSRRKPVDNFVGVGKTPRDR